MTTTVAYPVMAIPGPFKGEVADLAKATVLYQAVRGTSENSIYFLLANFGPLKLAGRWRDAMLSFRVAGRRVASHKEAISDTGLEIKNDVYASVHLSGVFTPILARKSLGSIIYGLGLPLLSPTADITRIRDLGQGLNP